MLEYHPVTRERLADLARFSERHGTFRYCSCMRWRMTSAEYSRSAKANRIAALDALVEVETPVGVLAYLDGEPVGWVSVAPRETYGALERYRALARIDGAPVWSVACFFIDRHARRQGVTLGLLNAAVTYALEQGATIIEGYPVAPDARLYTYMGSPATFLAAGFVDVTLAGRARLVMRYTVSAGEWASAHVVETSYDTLGAINVTGRRYAAQDTPTQARPAPSWRREGSSKGRSREVDASTCP